MSKVLSRYIINLMPLYSAVHPLDADVLEPPIGNGFAYLLDFRARESVFYKLVVRVLAELRAGVD